MSGLISLLIRLLDANFEFVIVGGYAGVLHGSSLVTRDVDICVSLTPVSIRQLRTILAPVNPRHRMDLMRRSFLVYPPDSQPLNDIYLSTDEGVLDVLSEIKGVGNYERVRRGAVAIPLFGHPCLVLSLPDLIQGKEAMGREKDLIASKELRAIAAKLNGR